MTSENERNKAEAPMEASRPSDEALAAAVRGAVAHLVEAMSEAAAGGLQLSVKIEQVDVAKFQGTVQIIRVLTL